MFCTTPFTRYRPGECGWPRACLQADSRANAANIHRVVGMIVIERRLQDSGGEVDVVLLWTVIRVHRGWSHAPFSLVGRLPNLRNVALIFKVSRTGDIANEV